VVEVQLDGETTILGALADSVKEVADIEPEQIQPPPRVGTSIKTDFIRGMGQRESELVVILDIDRVFAAEQMTDLRAVAA